MRSIRVLGSRLVVSLALCSAASCGGAAGAPADASAAGGAMASVGAPAPGFTAEPVTGSGPKTLDEAKGKVVVLDFWATFCKPCEKSFPKYQALVDQFGGEVVVLAVSVDEPEDITEKSKLLDFVKNTGVKFAVVWDKDQSIVKKKYGATKMPTSYIIDRQGVVRFIHGGYEAGEDVKIAEEVKGLVK